MATKRASPVLASQAENAKRSIGAAEKLVDPSWRLQTESARNNESIMASRHRSADRRWAR